MNWEAIGASEDLLAAVGVIVSLVYLATQIRQNTASVRARTFQEFTRESAETTRLALLDTSLLAECNPILQGETEFDPVRDPRFGLLVGLHARNLQFGSLELQGGRTDRRQFESDVSYHVTNWMLRPGWADGSPLNRRHYHACGFSGLGGRAARHLTGG